MPKISGSEAISHIEYDPETGICTVRWHSGSESEHELTSDEYEAFVRAPSKGKHFHKNVRNK